jgi:hypothetical protein
MDTVALEAEDKTCPSRSARTCPDEGEAGARVNGIESLKQPRGAAMRMMMKVQMDPEAASRAIADGSMPQVMQETLERLQPEAAYFGPDNGIRTAFIVFDLQDPSQLPPISEPLFSTLKANIQMFPVMDREDLKKGLGQLGGGA